MKLLHFADLHLDTPFNWATREHARNRRQALRDTLRRICHLADEHQVDALTCGGDLYEHDRFIPDTAEFLRATFAEIAPMPVFLAPGNHDWFGPTSIYHQVKWSPNVHVFEAPELTPVELTAGFTLWGAAHRAPANTPNFLDTFQINRGGVHVALFHGSSQGDLLLQQQDKVAHSPFNARQIEESGLHHAVLGHFHRPIDGVHHTYPGNPDPLAFGEKWEGAAVLVAVNEDGTVTRNRFTVATSVVSDVTVDLTGVTHRDEIRQQVRDEVRGLTGSVRVTLYGELDPEVDVRPQDIENMELPNLDALVARFGSLTVAQTDDFEQLAQEATVRGQFVRDVLADESLTKNQRQRILVTGLRALSDRNQDLEVF